MTGILIGEGEVIPINIRRKMMIFKQIQDINNNDGDKTLMAVKMTAMSPSLKLLLVLNII
jgi:hypothetical protein